MLWRKLFQTTEIREGKAVPVWRLTPANPLRNASGEAASLTTPYSSTGFLIVRHFEYLGIQLSDYNHADLTFSFRQRQAASKKVKVRKFVHSRRGSSTSSRLLIYGDLVWSSASFGLESSGLTPTCARKLQAWFSRQVAHLTKVRTTDLFAKFRITPPVQQIADRAEARYNDLRALSRQQPMSILSRPITSWLRPS